MNKSIIASPDNVSMIRVKSKIQYEEQDPKTKLIAMCENCELKTEFLCVSTHPDYKTHTGKFWCDKKVFGKWIAFYFKKAF